MVKIARTLVGALLTVAVLVAAAPGASAAPPTAPFLGSAVGDVVAVDLDLDGGPTFAGARLANSEATTDSTTTPQSTSVSRNLAAVVAGLGLTVAANTQTAPPDNPDPETGTLAAVTVDGTSAGAVTFSNSARVAATPTACLPSGTPYARTVTSTAGATIDPAGAPDLLDTGESTVETSTSLTSTGGNGFNRQVESVAVGTLSDVSLFGGDVDIEVAGDATLTAVADGTTGGAEVTYEAPTVTVNGDVVAVGGDTTIDLGATGAVTVTVNDVDETVAGTGLTAAGDVAVITLEIRVGPLGAPTGTATIDLLPLAVNAVVPAGGIDCAPPAPIVESPADGDVINDATPTYTGTGIPDAIVTLTVDGVEVADDIEVDEDGDWSFTPTGALADGDHTVSAIQTLNGTPSVASDVNAFAVDTDVPAAPVITAPTDGSTVTDNTPTITGTGEPGATVTVDIDGEEVGDAVVDGAGNWSLPLTDPLDEGGHTVTATQADEAGNVSPADEVTFVVDTEAAPPVITAPEDGSSTNDTTPTITGTAEPGASVAVEVDGEPVGTVTADEDGSWSLELTDPLDEGDHTVTAVQTDEAGNESDAAESDFTVDTTPPAAPVITSPDDGETVTDATPTIEGTGEVGATIVILLDGEPIGTVVVDEDGRWSFTLPALPDGEYTIAAIAVDAAGNESPADEITLVLDAGVIRVPTNGPQLADTGGPSLGWAVAGGVLLVAGGTVLSLTRRRA